MKFDQYYISSDIKKNLARLGFKRPTDIQFKAIPSIQDGEDVLAIAQTGTGKTAAFAIPVIDKIHRYKTSKRSRGIKCIVMVPTRELALQIGEVFKELAKHTKVMVFTLHGGIEQDAQIIKLQDGVDVLIATPGRMFDLISQGAIRLEKVSTLVLDEADHMLALGFIEDIRYIKKMLRQKHQTLFFSATINDEIRKLAYSQVNSAAIRIQISPEDRISKNVSHAVMFVDMDDKRFFLARFLQDHPEGKVMVFVRTKVRAERVAAAMARAGIEVLSIHGDKDQGERSSAMRSFREGGCRVLVATDISARGIDVADVAYVINYDLPDKPENYVHRVGRTGRGMNKGEAISFCSREERPLLEAIEAFITKPVEVMKVNDEGYADIIRTPDKAALELQALVAEHEAWLKGAGKKSKKRK
ncbi:DEAD/DEAH box helicase [Mariprofundus erugo]|uniref:DEAD/DEAH box helicase n=1 Tax=Mariprofundus erugo TaxID=2528639 RepID=UPI0010FE80A3|nr:DEAD/DEAH box helicase [Mariprofundus erugo]TLS77964.1 DEAD/DEAH box helicase [Mariprofundus erugo]